MGKQDDARLFLIKEPLVERLRALFFVQESKKEREERENWGEKARLSQETVIGNLWEGAKEERENTMEIRREWEIQGLMGK